jgi:hypothetical protein
MQKRTWSLKKARSKHPGALANFVVSDETFSGSHTSHDSPEEAFKATGIDPFSRAKEDCVVKACQAIGRALNMNVPDDEGEYADYRSMCLVFLGHINPETEVFTEHTRVAEYGNGGVCFFADGYHCKEKEVRSIVEKCILGGLRATWFTRRYPKRIKEGEKPYPTGGWRLRSTGPEDKPLYRGVISGIVVWP